MIASSSSAPLAETASTSAAATALLANPTHIECLMHPPPADRLDRQARAFVQAGDGGPALRRHRLRCARLLSALRQRVAEDPPDDAAELLPEAAGVVCLTVALADLTHR